GRRVHPRLPAASRGPHARDPDAARPDPPGRRGRGRSHGAGRPDLRPRGGAAVVSTFWDAGTIGRPDPGRQHRAQRLIERFHAGLIDGAAYLRELQALLAEEFAAELAGDLTVPAEAGRDER